MSMDRIIQRIPITTQNAIRCSGCSFQKTTPTCTTVAESFMRLSYPPRLDSILSPMHSVGYWGQWNARLETVRRDPYTLSCRRAAPRKSSLMALLESRGVDIRGLMGRKKEDSFDSFCVRAWLPSIGFSRRHVHLECKRMSCHFGPGQIDLSLGRSQC